MRNGLLFLALTSILAGQPGIAPRPSPADYPAHEFIPNGVLAAAIVPPRQVERMFSADVARHYAVVETAIYPQDGRSVDVDRIDFSLKIGNTLSRSEAPRDVATPWPEKNRLPDSPVTVTGETGVIYTRSSDPVNGRRSGWGTYQSVGVGNYPRNTPPPASAPGPSPLEQRVREKSLPAGTARSAVAGYLFFPSDSKIKKTDAIQLIYSNPNASAVLDLPRK